MTDLIRDSTIGQLINKFSRGRLLPYPDQRSDYVVPDRYRSQSTPVSRTDTIQGDTTSPTLEKGFLPGDASLLPIHPSPILSEALPTSSRGSVLTLCESVPGNATLPEKPRDVEEGDIAAEKLGEKLAAAQLRPEPEVEIDPFLVNWDGPNDPENPK